MPNLKQLIDELDELRAKATQGEWDDLHLEGVSFKNSEGYLESDYKRNYENTCYIIALHDSYPALRRVALAGEVLAEAVGEMDGFKISDGGNLVTQQWPDWKKQRDSALSVYHQALEEDK